MTDRFALMDTSAVSERMASFTPTRRLPHDLPVCTDPDIPPCDACGKEFSANLICNACHSAFYCSKFCQKNAWKTSGHKQSCADMKEQCVRDAKRVVQALTTRSVEDCVAMEADDGNILGLLDGAGPYKAAVEQGLYQALREAFSDEAENVVGRFRANKHKELWVISRAVLCYLFRGHRAEGRGNLSNQIDFADGQRIKAYVNSHPKAFDIWIDASMATYRLPFESLVWRRRSGSSNDLYEFSYQASRDVAAAWALVFTNKRAARAILLPGSTGDKGDDGNDSKEAASRAAIDRAKQIADRLYDALQLATRFSQRDPGRILEGEIYYFAGMVSCRVREFQIDFDFDGRLNLKRDAKQVYNDLIKPFCAASIEKGSGLTNTETKAAVAAHAAQKVQQQQQESLHRPSR
jgi:hypothetical protein